MRSLLANLKHQLSRAGLLENVVPWVEVNVGTDGVPRAAVREPLNTLQADKLVRAASRVVDLPPGAQIIFGLESTDDEISGEYIVVTTNPVTLIDRAVDLLSGFAIRPVQVCPGYAKLLSAYKVEGKRLQEWECYVDDEGYAHDDEGNSWFVGKEYAGGTYGLHDCPKERGGGGYKKPYYGSSHALTGKAADQVKVLQAALSKKPNNFLQSILGAVQKGFKLSDKQLVATRRVLHQYGMHKESGLFK